MNITQNLWVPPCGKSDYSNNHPSVSRVHPWTPEHGVQPLTHMPHNNLPLWTDGPQGGWYYSFSRISSLVPRNACLRTRGNEGAEAQNVHSFPGHWLIAWSCAARGTSMCTPCVVRQCAHRAWYVSAHAARGVSVCTSCHCRTAGTWGMDISSPKNIYRFYKAVKKKLLHLPSVSFVLRRSFIYQC